ncbi:hypothetical protein Ae201684P_015054 [Aphanomyces euteiches]|nr:hypothetical protein Ae201684P_015054 [Aphanomyces euteiches]
MTWCTISHRGSAWSTSIHIHESIWYVCPKLHGSKSFSNNALAMNKHDELLVLTDDISLPFGTVKFKVKGGHGGQNGVRDVIKCVATEKFARFKVGIGCPTWFANPSNNGNPPPGLQLNKYVLGRFQPHEQDAMQDLLEYCAALLRVYVHRGLNEATAVANSGDMHTYAKKKKVK